MVAGLSHDYANIGGGGGGYSNGFVSVTSLNIF